MAKRVRTSGSAAEKSEMPGFIKPQLATLKTKAPKGDWLHEIKYDGYRVQIHLNKGKKRVFTRNGLDWTRRFSVIAGALDISGQAIIDGEVVVVHEGRTNFSELQAELARGDQDRLVYYAFDLLWRDGDLRKLPQIERKQALSDLFSGLAGLAAFSSVPTPCRSLLWRAPRLAGDLPQFLICCDRQFRWTISIFCRCPG
jgi:ATP-dependent DNA ligase